LPQEVPGRSANDGKTMEHQEHHKENIEKHMENLRNKKKIT
jgi:hypothetical protein